MTSELVIGLGCVRQTGKDTLASLFGELDNCVVPYSFATALKADLAPFLSRHFGVDIWDCTIEEKELVRGMLIAYGMAQRACDPDYWVKRTLNQIEIDLSRTEGVMEMIPVITDCRFANEINLMRDKFPGFRFVNVTRVGSPPPTAEEEKHYREVSVLADIQFEWGNDTTEERLVKAADLLARLKASSS